MNRITSAHHGTEAGCLFKPDRVEVDISKGNIDGTAVIGQVTYTKTCVRVGHRAGGICN